MRADKMKKCNPDIKETRYFFELRKKIVWKPECLLFIIYLYCVIRKLINIKSNYKLLPSKALIESVGWMIL